MEAATDLSSSRQGADVSLALPVLAQDLVVQRTHSNGQIHQYMLGSSEPQVMNEVGHPNGRSFWFHEACIGRGEVGPESLASVRPAR